jgi:hypothetical protein
MEIRTRLDVPRSKETCTASKSRVVMARPWQPPRRRGCLSVLVEEYSMSCRAKTVLQEFESVLEGGDPLRMWVSYINT